MRHVTPGRQEAESHRRAIAITTTVVGYVRRSYYCRYIIVNRAKWYRGEIVSDYMRARRSGYFIHNFVPAGSTLRNIRSRSLDTDVSFRDSLSPMEYAVFLI